MKMVLMRKSNSIYISLYVCPSFEKRACYFSSSLFPNKTLETKILLVFFASSSTSRSEMCFEKNSCFEEFHDCIIFSKINIVVFW